MKKKIIFIYLFFSIFLQLFASESYNDFIIELDKNSYYLAAYYDTLNQSDRNALKSLFPKSDLFKDTVWKEADGNIIHKWYEENF